MLPKITGFLNLIRWKNLLIVVFNLAIIKLFLIDHAQPDGVWDFKFAGLVLSMVLITAAGYIINDYYDIKIDIVNKPQQVIVGRIITRRYALLWYFLFNFMALILVFIISKKLFILYFFSTFLLWYYSNHLKRKFLIGNISIAILTALSTSIPGIYYKTSLDIILFYALFAFGITLIREIIKDLEDIEGDRKYGCSTLPIILGTIKTRQYLKIMSIVFVFIYIILYGLNKFSLSWLQVPLVISYIYFIYYLWKSDTVAHYKNMSAQLKLIMIFGILSMLVHI